MKWIVTTLVLLCGFAQAVMAEVRVKDITSVRGVRTNQLIGYGLVTGLKGTGDSLRNAPFTDQSIRSMLERLGVNVRGAGANTRNVAAVMVTAELPPFINQGSRIDVVVTSIGDAASLRGGTLIMTPLSGADENVYAVAQGSVAVTGFDAEGESETLTSGVPTAGRIPNGALVERPAPGHFNDQNVVHLELYNPDFGTAVKVTDAINAFTKVRYASTLAREQDNRTVSVQVPTSVSPTRFVADIGRVTLKPDTPAKIVIDERTGTIVIGADVKISTVAVTHGNLTVRVTETPVVSQPEPFSDGETVVTSDTDVEATQADASLAIVKGTNIHTLVTGLNRMGLKPPGIIAILQAIKSTGALQAELVVH